MVVERVRMILERKWIRGYADPFEFYYNQLVREKSILGFVYSLEILDEERVPFYAIISAGCFGETGGFVSKFAPFDKNGIRIKQVTP